MDAIETQVQRTSPILRVTTDIKEFKSRDKEDNMFLETSSDRRSREDLRHASSLLQKKKQLRPILGSPNPYRSTGSFYSVSPYSISSNSKSNVSPFTQRVMSAKLLRVKKLQNELKETQIQLSEAVNENKILKTLQKRQDTALKKYEGDQAQLPQLIKSHNDDLRVVSTQYKQLKISYRDLEQKLRQREVELVNLKDQHHHLIQLSRDKHLGQREKLMKQVEDLQETIKEQNDKIQLLKRRVELESKNYKHQLNVEMARHKDTQTELAMAHETIETLKNLIEAKDKYINNTVPNRHTCGNVQFTNVFTNAPSTTRFRNVTKSSGSSQEKPVSEERINPASTSKLDDIDLDTDITSEPTSANNSCKLKSNSTYNLSTESTASMNFRKKLLTRKSRMKFSIHKNTPPLSISETKVDGDVQNDDTETPVYASSFPSIDNSEESLKYNTTSESDTMTKISLNRRRVSIDSAGTSISDNYNTTNNEDNDDSKEDSSNNNKGDSDKSVVKSKRKSLFNKKPSELNRNERLRRSSVSICEPANSPLESIPDALEKAKKKDDFKRKLMMDKEIKMLEEKLNKNSDDADNIIKFPLDMNDHSLHNLLDKRTQMMKDELKDFEERLLNSNNVQKYSGSTRRSFEDEANEVVKKLTSGFDLTENINYNTDEIFDPGKDGDGDIFKLNQNPEVNEVPISWDKMKSKYQDEEEHTDLMLDEYYKKMMLNDEFIKEIKEEEDDDDDELDDSKDVGLDDDEKEKLLKALKKIDLETGSRSSSKDDSLKGRRNSLNETAVNFDSSVGHTKVNTLDYEFSLLQSGNNDDSGDFTQEYDSSFIKSKNDLMAELFGKAKHISVADGNDLENT